ncbi:MAG: nucleotidyltransferase domain-containing protein [Gammaproteobacteria bacterium]|nr:nucleotidyltransferase domain-containing protein [Gammaproteobacteria bacterium]
MELNLKLTQSDIDIAIFRAGKTDKVVLWKLAQKIAVAISKDVDLIDLNAASTILRFQIINEGRRVYCNDNFKADFFENMIDSDYLDFSQRRAGLIKDIKARGRITNE